MNSHNKNLTRLFIPLSVFLFALLLTTPFQAIYADDTTTDASTTPDTTIATTTDTIDLAVATSTIPDISATSTTPDTGSNTDASAPDVLATSTDDTSTTTASASDITLSPSDDSGATTTPSTPQTGTATITVRDGSVIAWTGTVSFPIGTSTSDVVPVDISPATTTSISVPVLDQSLLGALLHTENTETGFNLSDLTYYSDYGEFFISCISVPAASATPDCYNWQYQVNGGYSFDSVDQYQLHDGDQVYLYFGNPRQVVLATSTVSAGESFVATAESYVPTTNTYVPAPGYTIGATQPDPNNPYSPTEIATSTTDENGNATLTLSTPGSYGIGLEEDGYYPVIPITVTTATSTATSTDGDSGNTSGNSGGGGSNVSPATGNTTSAFSFLINQQNSDGSFAGTEITDWSALALALPDAPSSARAKLAHFLTTTDPLFSITRDYERHALALMTLGINPYSGSPQDTITPIIHAFNGSYVVDSASDPTSDNTIANIFALIVLPHAGYTSSDSIIQKVESFVLSAQKSDGSWFNDSPDITAAAIQALSPLPGTSGAIAKAESFLHQNQQLNGGFSDSDSTSWVLNALATRNESPANWVVGTTTPLTYLASTQQSDGGILNDPSITNTALRTWSTAYALTAFEGRSWSSLLGSFSKPATTSTSTATGSGSLSSNSATTTDATSTPSVPALNATSTPILPTFILPLQTSTSTTVHFKKKLTVKTKSTATASTSSFTVSTTSIADAVTNRPLTAGAASAPAATSFWGAIAGMFSFIGSIFHHLF